MGRYRQSGDADRELRDRDAIGQAGWAPRGRRATACRCYRSRHEAPVLPGARIHNAIDEPAGVDVARVETTGVSIADIEAAVLYDPGLRYRC